MLLDGVGTGLESARDPSLSHTPVLLGVPLVSEQPDR